MIDREKVVSHFKDAIQASGNGNQWRFVRVDILEDAITLLQNRTEDYKHWAKAIAAHTCATCARASDNIQDGTTRCPIEEHYALVKDGYCHLWEET